MKDILIRNKYRVERKIAEGGFGIVYLGSNIESGEEVAIKLEHVQHPQPVLRNEADIYDSLAGGVGIPRKYWFGDEWEYYVMILELLGPSLEDLFEFCNRKFSLKTVLLLADQFLPRIEYLHKKHLVHYDIKPDNFLLGTGKLGNVVYIIDFGLAVEYRHSDTGKHRGYYENMKLRGTALFASVNNHLGTSQSCRDDLEAIGYIFIYFLSGSLPWQRLQGGTTDETNDLIKKMKENISIADLCKGLPDAFVTYFKHVKALGYEDRPNYAYLRKLFRNLFVREGFHYDYVFDWTIKEFYRLKDSVNSQSSSERGQHKAVVDSEVEDHAQEDIQ